jgi:hypothetical protein
MLIQNSSLLPLVKGAILKKSSFSTCTMHHSLTLPLTRKCGHHGIEDIDWRHVTLIINLEEFFFFCFFGGGGGLFGNPIFPNFLDFIVMLL